jgi:hypothetical protein
MCLVIWAHYFLYYSIMSRASLVTMTGYGLTTGVAFPTVGRNFSLHHHTFIRDMGLTDLPTQWALGTHWMLKVKRPERDTNHSTQSSATVNNA